MGGDKHNIYLLHHLDQNSSFIDNCSFHAVVRNPREIPCPRYPVPPSVNVLQLEYKISLLTLVELRYRKTPSPGRSLMIPFYSHTYFPPIPAPFLSHWQPLVCPSSLKLCHFRNVYKWNQTICDLLGLTFFKLSIILWIFIQFIAYVTSLFIFIAE